MIFGEGRAKDLYRKVMWGPAIPMLETVPAPWEHRIVRNLGRVAAALAPHKRRQVCANLRRAFDTGLVSDGRSVEEVAVDAFAAHFANQYIGSSFAKCDETSWPKYLAWQGLERLIAARQRGRGVVLAHPHMGPAQLPLHVLGTMGWSVSQVGGGRVTSVDLSQTGRWAAERRSGLEAQMPVTVHDGKRYLRPLLRALSAGGVLLTACDGTGGGEEIGRRIECTVLGQVMPLPVGPVWLAAQSGAALLTVCCYRNPGDGALYMAEVGDEIPLDRDLPMGALLDDGTRRLAAWLDSVLRAHPGDWLFWDGFAPGALLPETHTSRVGLG